MAEEEAAEAEAVSEGGSGYALMTDAWPTCAKVSSRIIRGIHKTPTSEIVWELYGILYGLAHLEGPFSHLLQRPEKAEVLMSFSL